MTGNLPMGGNKITGLAAATLASDAVRFDQLPTFTPTTATLTAGTNAQGQGPITTDQVTITVAAANPSGATLPTAVTGDRVIIANRGANPVNIYPATGAAIGALATNAPVLLAVNQSVEFFARSATQWEGQISQPLDADLTAVAALSTTGLVTRTGAGTMATRQITSSNGTVSITNPAGVAGDINLSVSAPVLLASKTASSSATLDFTEFNNGLYSRYVFEIEDMLPATNSTSFRCRFSTNGGSSYDAGGTDYIFIAEDFVAAGFAVGDGNTGQPYIELTRASASNTAGIGGICCEAHVVNAGNASTRTKIYGTGAMYLSGGSIAVMRFHGQRAANQDTDAVRFFFSSGNIASGRIRMYGIV